MPLLADTVMVYEKNIDDGTGLHTFIRRMIEDGDIEEATS